MEEREERLHYSDIKHSLSMNIFYIIVGIISIAAITFLPMTGTNLGEAGLGIPDPSEPNGLDDLYLFIVTRLATAIMNVAIVICFVNQAKINVRNEEPFKQAQILYGNISNKIRKPLSETQYKRRVYIVRCVTVFVTSIAACIAFANMIIDFDLSLFLTYLFTTISAVAAGLMAMKNAEVYYTTDYLHYAELMVRQINEKEEKECSNLITESIETSRNKS